MSVAKQASPATARFARWALGCAVRHWPEENRAWGAALAAEIDETASAFETVRWALGGIMFFMRSVLSSAWRWVKLPTGSSLPGGPERPSMLPKRSRLFTAAVLAAAAVLLLLPEGREAIRTVGASWEIFLRPESDQRTLNKMAVRAEREKDASTLAFVALRTRDSKRAAELVDRTISVDPSLIWVYGARHRASDDPARAERLERLQAADPGNAAPLLFEADMLGEAKLRTMQEHGLPTKQDYEGLASDQRWMGLMERAFASPKYDTYFRRHIELTRAVWNRNESLPLEIILFGFWSHAIPNLYNMKVYSEIEIHAAQKAGAAGDWKQAEKLVGQVSAFGVRMTESSQTSIEKLIGLEITGKAEQALAEVYASEGKTDAVREAKAQVQQIDKNRRGFSDYLDPRRAAREQAFRKRAVFVQGFGLLGGFAGFVTIAGILLLEAWPGKNRKRAGSWRRVLCFALDYGPATLLAACAAFLVSFLPFQRALGEYRKSSFLLVDQQRITVALWSLIRVPEYVVGVDRAVALWSTVTISLTVLAVFILAWGLFRTKRTVTNPS